MLTSIDTMFENQRVTTMQLKNEDDYLSIMIYINQISIMVCKDEQSHHQPPHVPE
jgi:hypothetical protein